MATRIPYSITLISLDERLIPIFPSELPLIASDISIKRWNKVLEEANKVQLSFINAIDFEKVKEK